MLMKKIDMLYSFMPKNPLKATGFLILIAMLAVSLFAPWISPYDPRGVGIPFQHPSIEHLLGTNDMGYDIFSEILYGTRISLLVGLTAASISIFIGVTMGALAGYYRGRIEELVMGTVDTFLVIPTLPLMIIMAAYLGAGIINIILVIGLLSWCGTTRVVHSRVLQVKEMPFIESTRALGYSDFYIITKHVLINTKDVIRAKFCLAVGSAMLTEASLSFLGLGDPLNISWGQIINYAFNRGGFAQDLWWWYVTPGIMISISIAAFMLIGLEDKKDSSLLDLI